MNKMKKTAVLLCLAGSLALGQFNYVEATSIVDSSNKITTVETVPHVLTTGTTSDLEKKKTYNISVSEQEKEKVYIPIVATNAGLISCDMQCKSNVVTAGSVTAVICTDKKGTVVKGTEKKLNLGKKNDEYVTSFYAKKGKTYYLQLEVSEKTMTENGEFRFQLELQEISSANRTLKNKQVVKAYQDGKGSVIYYKVKVTKTGYLTVNTSYDEENCGSPVVVLCNSKKKAISLKVKNDALSKNKTVFAVKKGTYYLKVKDVKGGFQIRSTFTSVADKSGTSKAKAKALKVGGKKVKAVLLTTDKKSKYDWYKFTLKKSSYIRINFTGSTTGSSKAILEVIPPASNVKFKTKSVLQFSGIEENGSGQGATAWPAGTWYIRVNKSVAKGSGVYSLQVKTFH